MTSQILIILIILCDQKDNLKVLTLAACIVVTAFRVIMGVCVFLNKRFKFQFFFKKYLKRSSHPQCQFQIEALKTKLFHGSFSQRRATDYQIFRKNSLFTYTHFCSNTGLTLVIMIIQDKYVHFQILSA